MDFVAITYTLVYHAVPHPCFHNDTHDSAGRRGAWVDLIHSTPDQIHTRAVNPHDKLSSSLAGIGTWADRTQSASNCMDFPSAVIRQHYNCKSPPEKDQAEDILHDIYANIKDLNLNLDAITVEHSVDNNHMMGDVTACDDSIKNYIDMMPPDNFAKEICDINAHIRTDTPSSCDATGRTEDFSCSKPLTEKSWH